MLLNKEKITFALALGFGTENSEDELDHVYYRWSRSTYRPISFCFWATDLGSEKPTSRKNPSSGSVCKVAFSEPR